MDMLGQLLLAFGKIGLFALGGGNSLLKLIEEECVENRAWLTVADFSSMVGMSFMFPGLTAVKVAGFIGLKVAGVPGLIASVLGLILPGLILAGLFYGVLVAHRSNPYVMKLIEATKYAGLALLLAAVYSFAMGLWGEASSFRWQPWALTGLLFVAVAVVNISAFISLLVFLAAFLLLA